MVGHVVIGDSRPIWSLKTKSKNWRILHRIVVHLNTMKPKVASLKIGYFRVQSGYKQIASLKHSKAMHLRE